MKSNFEIVTEGWFSHLANVMRNEDVWDAQTYSEIHNEEMGGENQKLVEEVYCVIVKKDNKYYVVGTSGTYTIDFDESAIEEYDEVEDYHTFQNEQLCETMIAVKMKTTGSYFSTSISEIKKIEKLIEENVKKYE